MGWVAGYRFLTTTDSRLHYIRHTELGVQRKTFVSRTVFQRLSTSIGLISALPTLLLLHTSSSYPLHIEEFALMQSGRSFIARIIRYNQHSMKFRSTSVLGLVLATQSTSASAWVPSTSRFTSSLTSRNAKRYSSVLFSSTAVPVEPDQVAIPSALQPTGNVKAEGNIISAFPGGLTAVRVNDDDVAVAPTAKVVKPLATPDSPSFKADVQKTTSNSGLW